MCRWRFEDSRQWRLVVTVAVVICVPALVPLETRAQSGVSQRRSVWGLDATGSLGELSPEVVLADNSSAHDKNPEPVLASVSDAHTREVSLENSSRVQPQPPLAPRAGFAPAVPMPITAVQRSVSVFGTANFGQTDAMRELYARLQAPGTDVILGSQAKPRLTTDIGSLLGKSPQSLGSSVQRRTPVVTDARVRGSRIGQLPASGSFWIPARVDLDTSLSKIDSRLIEDVTVINGPYTARRGPGLDFIDIALVRSPRYERGFEGHGSTGFDFGANGQQWSGLQRVWGGHDDWGFVASYGHRTGNDYTAGSGIDIASSYNSRDAFLTFGKDLSDDSSLELTLLRLDQTGMEFPGYVFDMDFLVTNAFEMEYVLKDQPLFDVLSFETWFNDTRFHGNAQNPSKRDQFPLLNFYRYEGYTNVYALSTGFTLATTWGDEDGPQLTTGTDLRFIKQSLDEIGSGRIGFLRIQNANSPLPKSEYANPGIFVESSIPATERFSVTAGARVDWMNARVTEDPDELTHLGFRPTVLQSSLDEILGTDRLDQNFATWGAFLTGRYEVLENWALLAAAGHGQRPPSLTELYVAESFMLLLQNGMNSATGDPLLASEKKWQVDLGLACNYERFRGRATAFYAWINDYITFENMGVFIGPPAGQVEQESLKFVNTDLAVLTGFELAGELDATDWLTPFGTLRYVEGWDLTRDGSFATRPASFGSPSQRIPGLPRGFFGGVAGNSEEPLPGIIPMESRLGIRVHQPGREHRWGVELSAHVVNGQQRVAASLLELPTPGFTTWDVRTFWRSGDSLLLVAGVENFGDRNYREHLDFRNQSGIGMYQPGTNFYFGSELMY